MLQQFRDNVTAVQRQCYSSSETMLQQFRDNATAVQRQCYSSSETMLQQLRGKVTAVQRQCYSSSETMLQQFRDNVTAAQRQCYSSSETMLQQFRDNVTVVKRQCYRSSEARLQQFRDNVTAVQRHLRKEGGCGATNWLWRLGMFLCVSAFAVYCVGFSTDYWLQLDDEPASIVEDVQLNKHSGLWRRCFSFYDNSTKEEISGFCEDVGNSHGYRVVSKIMCTIGLMVSILGLVASAVSGFFNSAKLLGVAGFLVVFGGLIAGVGSSVLLGKSLDDDSDVDAGYSAFMAIFGSIGLLIAGTTLLCSIRTGYNSIA
ncbi:hypothetical protein RRG08_053775 [Elysia crispata]|uniref:Uncharacterized protein n=1 Tax=Elysia crispata TaxID=231223 RepID=A0AAE1D5J5_9GAST|nr:hypothetical protein RRG08_053775 [Elysia crispata]